jgi:hypothetical protein
MSTPKPEAAFESLHHFANLYLTSLESSKDLQKAKSKNTNLAIAIVPLCGINHHFQLANGGFWDLISAIIPLTGRIEMLYLDL